MAFYAHIQSYVVRAWKNYLAKNKKGFEKP